LNKDGQTQAKNYPKYSSYKNAFDHIKLSIDTGFYLEAITIEESILCDRLLRFCIENGYSRSADRATLGHEIAYIKDKLRNHLDEEGFTFLIDLESFWVSRNICLHQIAKSEPGEATQDFEEILGQAKVTSILGNQLAKKVTKWAGKYKLRHLDQKT
jgi:hypothetical protein